MLFKYLFKVLLLTMVLFVTTVTWIILIALWLTFFPSIFKIVGWEGYLFELKSGWNDILKS